MTIQFPPDRGVGPFFPQTTAIFNQGGRVYQEQALKTAKRVDFTYDLNHAALGIGSEAGEFLSSVKAHLIYGKPLDRENLKEELGDLMWFINLACDTLNLTWEEIQAHNIDKLKKRYPEKYSDEAALARFDKQIADAM